MLSAVSLESSIYVVRKAPAAAGAVRTRVQYEAAEGDYSEG